MSESIFRSKADLGRIIRPEMRACVSFIFSFPFVGVLIRSPWRRRMLTRTENVVS